MLLLGNETKRERERERGGGGGDEKAQQPSKHKNQTHQTIFHFWSDLVNLSKYYFESFLQNFSKS